MRIVVVSLVDDPSCWRAAREWVMARRKSLRSQLYRAARDLGNVQAARGGPTSYGKRVVRRKVYRTTNGINRRVLKDLSCSHGVRPG
jgi:hypothetical protein